MSSSEKYQRLQRGCSESFYLYVREPVDWMQPGDEITVQKSRDQTPFEQPTFPENGVSVYSYRGQRIGMLFFRTKAKTLRLRCLGRYRSRNNLPNLWVVGKVEEYYPEDDW